MQTPNLHPQEKTLNPKQKMNKSNKKPTAHREFPFCCVPVVPRFPNPVTPGEMALIKALREAPPFEIFPYKKTLLIKSTECVTDNHVAILTSGTEKNDIAIIRALKQIQWEHYGD